MGRDYQATDIGYAVIAKIAKALQSKFQKLQTAKFCKNQIMQNLQTPCKTDANTLQNGRELGEHCELQFVPFDGYDTQPFTH